MTKDDPFEFDAASGKDEPAPENEGSQTGDATNVVQEEDGGPVASGDDSNVDIGHDSDNNGVNDSYDDHFGQPSPPPRPADSDGDGLTDDIEEKIGTDPFDRDTDGDNLTDYQELRLGTDPLDADTDGDGIGDFREVDAGLDPLDPADGLDLLD